MSSRFDGVFLRWVMLFFPLRTLCTQVVTLASMLFIPLYMLKIHKMEGSLLADIATSFFALGFIGLFIILLSGCAYLFEGTSLEKCRHDFSTLSCVFIAIFTPLTLGKMVIWYLIFGQEYLALNI